MDNYKIITQSASNDRLHIEFALAKEIAKAKFQMKSKGFTLIEILIVLVILSITSLLATLAINRLDASQNMEHTGEEILAVINYLQRQAILTNHPYGLVLNGQTVQAYQIQYNPRTSDTIWHQVKLPTADFLLAKTVNLQLHVKDIPDYSPEGLNTLKSILILTPDGKIPDFNLDISSNAAEQVYYRIRSQNSSIELVKIIS